MHTGTKIWYTKRLHLIITPIHYRLVGVQDGHTRKLGGAQPTICCYFITTDIRTTNIIAIVLRMQTMPGIYCPDIIAVKWMQNIVYRIMPPTNRLGCIAKTVNTGFFTNSISVLVEKNYVVKSLILHTSILIVDTGVFKDILIDHIIVI
ncbi:MAG: hypothetical protein V1681_06870 [Candidatus Neomarinimicrobiota bacterium]